MISLYDFNEVNVNKKQQKKRFIFLLAIDLVLIGLIVALFILLNRSNYIWLSILISLLMFICLAGSFFFIMNVIVDTYHINNFLNHLNSCEGKTNYIFGLTIKEEMINKYHMTFYVVEVEMKNKKRECYLEANKLELIKDKKINRVEIRDRILVNLYEGEYVHE